MDNKTKSNRYSSRKFWTMILVSVAWTLMVIGGTLDQETYQFLMTISVGGYFSANCVQKFAERSNK